MASRALNTRFMMTCSICATSAFTRPKLESRSKNRLMSSPTARPPPSSAPASTPPRLARVRQSLSLVLQREDAPFPPYRQRTLINQPSGFPRERQRSAKKIARWRVFLAEARHELAKLTLETQYPFPGPIPPHGAGRIRSDRRFPRRRRIPLPSSSVPRLGGSSKTALDSGILLAESP